MDISSTKPARTCPLGSCSDRMAANACTAPGTKLSRRAGFAHPASLRRRLLARSIRLAEVPEGPQPPEEFTQAGLAPKPAAFSGGALADRARLTLGLSTVLRPHLQPAATAPPLAAVQL